MLCLNDNKMLFFNNIICSFVIGFSENCLRKEMQIKQKYDSQLILHLKKGFIVNLSPLNLTYKNFVWAEFSFSNFKLHSAPIRRWD